MSVIEVTHSHEEITRLVWEKGDRTWGVEVQPGVLSFHPVLAFGTGRSEIKAGVRRVSLCISLSWPVLGLRSPTACPYKTPLVQ